MFEAFEKAVMEKLLEGTGGVSTILYQQYIQARVIKREFTGVGFFSDFEVPQNAIRVKVSVYGDVRGRINGSDFIYCFLLFLDEGQLSFLEGVTCLGSWPDIIENYELKDIEELL